MFFLAQVPMSSHVHPTQLYCKVYRDVWLKLWPNFRRSSRCQNNLRQVSVNRCHTSFKPWADWKETNTSMWQNAKHIWVILIHFGYLNHQNFVLGYLAQALLHHLSLHRDAWKSWKQVGWDRDGFKVSGNMWTQSTVLLFVLSIFELLSGCC